ncbi:MAG: tyrosine-type recombinase/integrase [Actinomycetota bacterium]|nr:tyrosine-type recombinase/integrase [Actinomycetota bacterium]
MDLLRRRLRIEESIAEIGGRIVAGATKTHAVRTLPLSPNLASALESHLATLKGGPDRWLFTSPKGSVLRYRDFHRRIWRPTLEELGIPPVGLHVLRHSAAARMIGAGASPKAVQMIMGHRSGAFTLTVYGHLFDADLDDLAARLDGNSRPARGLAPLKSDGGQQ